MQLDSIDFLHSPRIQQLQEQVKSAETENQKRIFLSALTREIVNAINNIASQQFEDGVTVNNFDEVTAALQNQLTKANKPIMALLKGLNLTTEAQTKLISDIDNKAQSDFKNEFQPLIIKRQKQLVHIDNLHEIPSTEEVSVNNLTDLLPHLKDISDKISALTLDVNIEAPKITVNPTPINIPATVFPEAINLEPLLRTIESGLNRIRTNSETRPLAVRLSDGQNWLKEIVKIQQETSKAVAAFAGGNDQIRLLDSNRNFVNPASAEGQLAPSSVGDGTATVVTAGTRVQLSVTSVPCSRVIVVGNSANVGKIWLGGATIATARGRPLNQEQSEVLRVRNLNLVYIDADNSNDGVTFAYEA